MNEQRLSRQKKNCLSGSAKTFGGSLFDNKIVKIDYQLFLVSYV